MGLILNDISSCILFGVENPLGANNIGISRWLGKFPRPAWWRVSNSSLIAFSHNGQLGQHFASAKVHGPNASTSLVLAAISSFSTKFVHSIHSACPSPSSTGVGSLAMADGGWIPRWRMELDGQVEVYSWPAKRSAMHWLGFQTHFSSFSTGDSSGTISGTGGGDGMVTFVKFEQVVLWLRKMLVDLRWRVH